MTAGSLETLEIKDRHNLKLSALNLFPCFAAFLKSRRHHRGMTLRALKRVYICSWTMPVFDFNTIICVLVKQGTGINHQKQRREGGMSQQAVVATVLGYGQRLTRQPSTHLFWSNRDALPPLRPL